MAANLPDLPDVFLLSVFENLNAEDRLKASQICFNWYHRVREVNKAVKFLNIIIGCRSFENMKQAIDHFNFGYDPRFKQQLMKVAKTEDEKENQENPECCNKWNTLEFAITNSYSNESIGPQLSSTIVEQIMTAFPAVTELNFINRASKEQYKYLVQMIKISENGWGKQLSTLRLMDAERHSASVDTSQLLFTAINCLPALKRLVIIMGNGYEYGLQMQDLPVLARLKEVRFGHCGNYITLFTDNNLFAFLRSVKKYVPNNSDLQIDLPSGLSVMERLTEEHTNTTDTTLLEPNIRKRIIRVNNSSHVIEISDFKFVCKNFPNLTSLTAECPPDEDCAQMFADMSSHLLHLRYLKAHVNFKEANVENYDDLENRRIIDPSPTSSLLSLKVLELNVIITSHSDLQWLNLPVIFPNLEAIYIDEYSCTKCDAYSSYQLTDGETELAEGEEAQQCFEAVLSQLSYNTGLSLEQIAVKINDEIISANTLLDEDFLPNLHFD